MEQDPSRERRTAIPILLFKLGTLSPAFVSADDAARYVHEQIGSRRTLEYGSVILQRLSDQRFVASEPIADRATVFDWGKLLERKSPTEDFLHPPGYKIVGCLHSHPDRKVSTQAQNPTWTAQQVETFISFFSVPDIVLAHRERAVFTVAYLSGPHGTLLKYEHSGSAAESGFVQWLAANGPWTSPHAHDGTIEGLYKKYASVGRLTFLVSSSAWGGALGAVPQDWTPYVPFASSPEPVACGPLFTTDEAAWAYAQRQLDRKPTRERLVFILKSDQGNEYLASSARVVPADQLPADYWFPGLASGPAMPMGFHLHGFYCNAPLATQNVPVSQSWLYQNFFRPAALSRYIAKARQYSLEGVSVLGLALYLRTSDGALLQYQFSSSPAETLLMARDQNGTSDKDSQQALMLAGALSPQQYVARVAAAGRLSVVHTSRIWDQAGDVGPDWRPFSKIPEPTLSPPFINADDAARWAHDQIAHSMAAKEYGGAILKRGNRYFATAPVAGEQVMFDHRGMLATDADDNFIAPVGYSCEALYHSHPPDMAQVKAHNPGMSDEQASVFVSFFSPADLSFIIEHRRSVAAHYLCGPEGSLLKYVSSGSAAEALLRKRILGEEQFAPSTDFESLIWQAAEAGELRVVVANARWGGVRGRVKKTWKINTAVTQSTEEQPFFTQVFEQPDLAVRRAQALLPAGAAQGFVLKHLQGEGYVATYPETAGAPLFSAAERFPLRADGQLKLPSNFRLEAIYYRSTPLPADTPERESWLYSTFFSPAEVVAAITQARATLTAQSTTRGLRLYQLAADGALLELAVPGTETDLAREPAGGGIDDNGAQAALLAGTLSPRGYVRRVIMATRLSVVEAGLLWRDIGPVDNRSVVLSGFYRAVLSRSFISAHDAALYAHEQIGRRRDRVYGGYVLKDDEGRFLITEPQESAANPFAHPLFFPVDGQGPLIPPEPYQIQARYGSHVALSMVEPRWVEQRRWTREEAEINVQVFSAEEIREVIQHKRTAYLSGSDDCLLAYTPSRSADEARLLNLTEPQPGGSEAQKHLDSGQTKPSQWVVRLAEAGDLRIIQGNPLWGPRSPVYKGWTPHFAYAPRLGPPDYVTYGAVFDSADAAARDLHARVHGRNLPEQAYFGFILRHKDKPHYLATEVVGVDARNVLFNLNSVFALAGDRRYQFPTGFVPCGLFRSQQWQPAGLSTVSAWLTHFFVRPTLLYGALYDSKRGGDTYNDGKPLPVYFSTQEGALLRYVSLPYNVESGGPLDTLLAEAETALASGKKTPQAFVGECVSRGELYVVRTSQCWDTQGSVPRTWSGYENHTRRRLSPAFASPDDAARHAAAMVGQGRQRAYGGVLLRLADGWFVATHPLAVPPQGFALDWIYPGSVVAQGFYPEGAMIVARYRSVVGHEVRMLLSANQKAIYQSMLPTGVLATLLQREVHVSREYLFGPQGSILRYQLTGSTDEEALKQQLMPLNSLKGDPGDNDIERQFRNGTLHPGDFVAQVAKAGDLRVIKGNELWGFARRLSGAFVPYVASAAPLEIKQVFADAQCSPLFTQAYDAVRYAQRQSSPQALVQFGYVLKSVKKNLYMTTLPLIRADYAQFGQVFVDGLLPQDYTLAGLYLCASTQAIAPSSDEMASHFFSPQELANGVGFVSNLAKNGALPLYLLCADGALLRYSFRKNGRQSLYALTSQAALAGRQLLGGTLAVADYVRGLAAVGELYVRVRSAVWGKEQAVTAQWLPKADPWPVQDNPHFLSFCGPLCSHADDAALWADKQLGGYKDREYLGAVLASPGNLGFVALDPVEDRHAWLKDTIAQLFWFDHLGFDIKPDHPLFFYTINAVHAFYKIIPSTISLQPLDRALLDNFVSRDDLRLYQDIVKSNRPVAKSVYLSCRGGALLNYVPSFTLEETQLLGVGSSPLPSALVSRLREVGKLSVLETDSFWTRLGTLGTEWQIKDVQTEPDPQAVQYGRDKDEL